jgi:hypothetical protein
MIASNAIASAYAHVPPPNDVGFLVSATLIIVPVETFNDASGNARNERHEEIPIKIDHV